MVRRATGGALGGLAVMSLPVLSAYTTYRSKVKKVVISKVNTASSGAGMPKPKPSPPLRELSGELRTRPIRLHPPSWKDSAREAICNNVET